MRGRPVSTFEKECEAMVQQHLLAETQGSSHRLLGRHKECHTELDRLSR